MLERFRRSWELVKASAAVLKADKELLVFPLISTVVMLFVAAGFAIPMFIVMGERLKDGGPLNFVVGFLFYFVSYFVIFFCNSALVGAALIRLRGGDPTVADGFRIAMSRVVPILGYAAIAATVGVILRSLQERAGFLGRIVVGLLGMGWSLATFLVVPVLVSEDLGPVDSVKRSMGLLKKTWGEQFVGNGAIGGITILAVLALAAVFVPLGIAAGSAGSVPLVATVVVVGLISLMMLSLISATLTGIYTAAVYRYAADGEIGFGFNPELVETAFRPK